MRKVLLSLLVAAAVIPAGTWAQSTDPTDKMVELGMTSDGKSLPTKQALPDTSKMRFRILQKDTGESIEQTADKPAGFDEWPLTKRAEYLVRELTARDNDVLTTGLSFDGAVPAEEKNSVVCRFTLASPPKNPVAFVEGKASYACKTVAELLTLNLAPSLEGMYMRFRIAGETDYRSLDSFMPPPPVTPQENGIDMTPDGPVLPEELLEEINTTAPTKSAAFSSWNSPRPAGQLSGKTVYINQGHGKVWRGTNNQSYSYQRTFTQDNMEDLSNADLMNQYLTPYLWNAGAETFSVRETDQNPNMVIVDNDDAAGSGGYGFSTTGSWSTSSVSGFRNRTTPYGDDENPFTFGTAVLADCTAGTIPTATATWAARIPASGWYNVYVSHIAYNNRTPAAKYQVYHAGGVTDCTLDQRKWRNTWIPLGRFFFEKNAPADQSKVVLSNVSTSQAHLISADAVRFGGGRGNVARGTAGTSGEPRAHEDCRYNLQFMGMSASGTNGYSLAGYDPTDRQVDEADGWGARPRFARWMQAGSVAYGAPSTDNSMIACHTNAGGAYYATYIRTSDMADNTNDIVNYQNVIHPLVIGDMNGIFTGKTALSALKLNSDNHGESNPNSSAMPILLGEWLHHDNASNMELYHHPRYKQTMARGMMRALISYWASKGKASSVFPPEPITNLCVLQESPTSVRLTWGAPPTSISGRTIASPATGYRIWVSEHGRAFPNAFAAMSAPSTGVPTYLVTGLTPGKPYYFKVTATNAGGESQAGDTLAARTDSSPNAKKVLIVQGFNKLDQSTRVKMPYSNGQIYRSIPDRMNSYDYIFEHLKGIDAYAKSARLPIKVDSCNKDSINGQWVLLGNYDAVIWMSGIEAEVCTWDPWDDTSLGANSRTYITNYLNTTGKAFFLSGSEVAWEMASTTKNVDKTFLNNTLKTGFVADSADLYSFRAVKGGIFDGMSRAVSFDDGSDWVRMGYQVQWADVLSTINGSTAALSYGSGEGTQIEAFDATGTWAATTYSGSTNVSGSTRSIDNTVKTEGSASMKLYAPWGTGTNVREYNTAYSTFTFSFAAGDTITYWVYGDNSGSTIRFVFGDGDGELWYHDVISINWTGWKQLSFKRGTDNFTRYAGSGDNVITGNTMKVNSFIWNKGASTATENTIWLDDLRVVSVSGETLSVAATQYGTPDTARVFFMGVPLEAVVDETQRNEMLARIGKFLLAPTTLTVNITPAEAVSAGAQWSIDGGATWNAANTAANVFPGSYTITYKTGIGGWTAPASSSVNVTNNTPAVMSGTYTRQSSVDDWAKMH